MPAAFDKKWKAPFGVEEIEYLIPHRSPMRFVDSVVAMTEGKSIHAQRTLSENDPVFKGHFPDMPILPGVHQIEGLAQASAVLIYSSLDEKVSCKLVGVSSAKFKNPVFPNDLLDYHVELLKSKSGFYWFKGQASVEGRISCVAEFSAKIG